MKKIILALSLFSCIAMSVAAQTGKGSIIVVKPDTVNIGEITLMELNPNHGKVQITVSNSGNQPLILNEVTGCCGTNIMEWPKAPILPGKSGVIKVEFRIEPRLQVISRTVTIKSNATNNKVVKVPITGVIIEEKAKNEIKL